MTCFDSIYHLDSAKFFRVYCTVHEMMADRGYKPVTAVLSEAEWNSKYLGYLAEVEWTNNIFDIIDDMILLFKKADTTALIYFHILESKLCQNDMKVIQKILKEKEASRLILIVNTNATPKVSSILDILGAKTQLFTENELNFNITKHQLVPRHEVVSAAERERVIKEYATFPDGVHL